MTSPLIGLLLSMSGLPLAAPSANPSGKMSPTRAEHVAATLGDKVAAIIDGGACKVGLESTVVDLSGTTPRLLRPGWITARDIEDALGMQLAPADATSPRAPGIRCSIRTRARSRSLSGTTRGTSGGRVR